MDIDELSHKLLPMIEELCEEGIPSPEFVRVWLEGSPEDDEDE